MFILIRPDLKHYCKDIDNSGKSARLEFLYHVIEIKKARGDLLDYTAGKVLALHTIN